MQFFLQERFRASVRGSQAFLAIFRVLATGENDFSRKGD
jgi:hypothetical protein